MASFPSLPFHGLGYTTEAVGQKSYNGVAVLARVPFTLLHRALPGLPQDDAQARYIEIEVEGMILIGSTSPMATPTATRDLRKIDLDGPPGRPCRKPPGRRPPAAHHRRLQRLSDGRGLRPAPSPRLTLWFVRKLALDIAG